MRQQSLGLAIPAVEGLDLFTKEMTAEAEKDARESAAVKPGHYRSGQGARLGDEVRLCRDYRRLTITLKHWTGERKEGHMIMAVGTWNCGCRDREVTFNLSDAELVTQNKWFENVVKDAAKFSEELAKEDRMVRT